jgi:tetratricopeptide (TPR) repeat protein
MAKFPGVGARIPRVWLAGLAIAFFGCLAYANSLSGPFVFDDITTIQENPSIRNLWTAVSTTGVEPNGLTLRDYGRPILNLSFALNYAFGGRSVLGYHVVNLAIHCAAALILFGLVRRTLSTRRLKERWRSVALPLAFAAASLWVLHPLQTESVTYLYQRAESLMGMFYLAALYGLVRADQGGGAVGQGAGGLAEGGAVPVSVGIPRRFWYLVSILSCFLGMASKQVMVTAPVMLLLYDRAFLSGDFRSALRARWGYYLGLGTSWILLDVLLRQSGPGIGGATVGFGIGIPWWKYTLTQPKALCTYLKLAVFPYPLVFEYGTRWAETFWEVLPYAVAIIGLLGISIVSVVRNRPAGFLAAWFFIILSPTSSFVPGETQLIVEHRMYLPLAAILVAAVLGLYALLGRRWIWFAVAFGVEFFALTHARNDDYRTAVSIWSDTVAKQPNNLRARNFLAAALNGEGRYAEAIPHYRRILSMLPDQVGVRVDLAKDLIRIGRPGEAVPEYEEVLKFAPNEAGFHDSLGTAYALAGRRDEAIRQFRIAIGIYPLVSRTHFDLAVLLAGKGFRREAAGEFRETLRLNPSFDEARQQLALLGETP